MNENIKVIRGGKFNTSNSPRYILIDQITGEVVDDAQGYGYRSAKKAYAAYAYKNRDKSKDKEIKIIKNKIRLFCKKNTLFIEELEELYFCIEVKRSYGENVKFDCKTVTKIFEENGFTNLDFEIKDFIKYWDK